MKPKVAIDFTDIEGGDGIVRLEFNDTEQIDELICTLSEMRQDLEEQIKREKQRRCEKRKRRKNNKDLEDALKIMCGHIDKWYEDTFSQMPFEKYCEHLSESFKRIQEAKSKK